MTFRYQWSEDLSVGFGDIDQQHQELFKRAEKLFDALNRGTGKAELHPMIGFLADYIMIHFASEEEYMNRLRYPKLSEHKEQHRAFTADFRDFVGKLEKSENKLEAAVRLQQKIIAWLVEHIRKSDKELANFLQAKSLAKEIES